MIRGWERRCLALPRSLARVYVKALGEKGTREEPVLTPKKMTGWATEQEELRFWMDTESMTTFLPQRKLNDLVEWLRAWPLRRNSAMVKEVLEEAVRGGGQRGRQKRNG